MVLNYEQFYADQMRVCRSGPGRAFDGRELNKTGLLWNAERYIGSVCVCDRKQSPMVVVAEVRCIS